MTKDEYKRRYDDLQKAIAYLQEQRKDLHAERLLDSEFKRGDKVKVNQKIYNPSLGEYEQQEAICFITGVSIDSWTRDFYYTYAKAKKDGSMSHIGKFFPGVESIELIERAESPQQTCPEIPTQTRGPKTPKPPTE